MPNSAADYYFLSLCLLYPQPEMVAQLRLPAEQAGPWATEVVAAFEAPSLETLQVEHTRLFVNSADGAPCPPYQSAYVDGHLMSATTALVAAFYAEWGVAQALEVADYLPVVLQFTAWLMELAAQSAHPEPVHQARRRFEAQHLHPWLARFAADLQAQTTLDCYRLVAVQLLRLAENLARPVA